MTSAGFGENGLASGGPEGVASGKADACVHGPAEWKNEDVRTTDCKDFTDGPTPNL
jgi:hypothetical protein